MANRCKHVALLGLLIFLELSGGASGEISAEDVYDLLSRSIFKIENDIDNIKRRIEKVEETVQGLSTTVSPQLEGNKIKEEEIMDLKENMNMQALAIKKTLTAEKLILRDTVETFESKFAEFKSQIQNEIVSINASLESKSNVMFDIVSNSSSWLENGIAELKADFSHTTNNISEFLDTMEITMMSNFENMEKRMAASITMQQREIYDVANNSAFALAMGIEELRSDWNSTTNNISEILKTTERTVQSNMKEIEKKIADDVARKQSTTQSTVNSLQGSLNSLSSTVSSIAYKQTYTIQPELSSLSSRISSVSSSLSSESTSMSSRISALSDRIYKEEGKKIAFSARMETADSYYNPGEIINDFRQVIYQYGNGFDYSTGIFTAPSSGTYLFSVNIASYTDKVAHVTIVKNGYLLAEAIAKGTDQTGGNTVVTYLDIGDKVWVQLAKGLQSRYELWKYRNQFTGILID